MALKAVGDILIEPDDQYTSVVSSTDVDTQVKLAHDATPNQTLNAAFDKVKTVAATLLTGGMKVRAARITIDIS